MVWSVSRGVVWSVSRGVVWEWVVVIVLKMMKRKNSFSGSVIGGSTLIVEFVGSPSRFRHRKTLHKCACDQSKRKKLRGTNREAKRGSRRVYRR